MKSWQLVNFWLIFVKAAAEKCCVSPENHRRAAKRGLVSYRVYFEEMNQFFYENYLALTSVYNSLMYNFQESVLYLNP